MLTIIYSISVHKVHYVLSDLVGSAWLSPDGLRTALLVTGLEEGALRGEAQRHRARDRRILWPAAVGGGLNTALPLYNAAKNYLHYITKCCEPVARDAETYFAKPEP